MQKRLITLTLFWEELSVSVVYDIKGKYQCSDF